MSWAATARLDQKYETDSERSPFLHKKNQIFVCCSVANAQQRCHPDQGEAAWRLRPQARASEQPPKAAFSESLIYALDICVASRKCEDPSTPLRSAQDDNAGGKRNAKL